MRGALAALLVLAACAPRPGPDDTVSLTPLGPEARADREAALRGDAAQRAGASPVLDAQPGRLGDDARFTGGPVPQLAPTPPPESYTVAAPQPLPERPQADGPGVVAFALETSHPVGMPVYARGATSPERAARACDAYPSAILAQQAFLDAGGPARDARGLDPDGDGYACGWDPAPFRNAVR